MVERALGRLGLATLAVAGLLIFAAAPAQACDSTTQNQFGISPGCFDIVFGGDPTAANAAPDYFQAAGHPYEVRISLRMNAPAAKDPINGEFWPPASLRDAILSLPAGFVANASVAPACSIEALTGSKINGKPICSPDSQVGLMKIYNPALGAGLNATEVPLFRIVAPAGVPARFGYNALGVPSTFDAAGGTSGLSLSIDKLSGAMPLVGLEVTLWGVPADPAHTPQRACPGQLPPGGELFGNGTPGPTCAATLPERAMLRLPTSCTRPVPISIDYDSWANPGQFQSRTVLTHLAPGLLGDPTAGGGYPAPFPGLDSEQWGASQGFEGCQQVPFDPSVEVRPSSHAADTPTGLDVEVSLPQNGLDDPDALAEADLKSAVTKFPAGLTLNPAVANGLAACSAAQIDLGSNAAPTCPDAAKLGTVEMTSPLLEGSLSGAIYIAEQGPGDPALPAYVVAGSGGLVVKLRAALDIDPATGQVSTTLTGTPQIPIGSFRMHFFGGDRAPFVTPPTCGSYVSEARFTPWSGAAPVADADSFAIGSGPAGRACPEGRAGRPFAPGFRAGVTSPFAGAASALTVKLSREDGEQEPAALELSLPAGLSASLRDVSTCSDAAIAAAEGRDGVAELAAPSCPEAARVGSAALTIGAGAEPFHLRGGGVYLAGPYKGSPLSLATVLPTVAGPIDLGTVVLRLPLTLDPSDGHLTLKSSLPTAQGGVPLNLRQLVLNIDRPGFITNPTSCGPAAIAGRLEGDAGARASVSSPFGMLGCDRLDFHPRLRTKVLGGPALSAHTAHPPLRFTVAARGGDANLGRAVIDLAGSEQLDPNHIRGICKTAQFAAGRCPASSVYGYAEVVSPLTKEPLRGPVYMRSSNDKLPTLVASLQGQLNLDLEAKIGFADGRMRIVMASLPDVPVSKLVLTTFGGRRGLFVNNRDLCAAPAVSNADLTAQNGKRVHQRVKLQAPCGPS